jgi:glyoxylase-like metal-dependent hydrolase (beta-lactamase superfamily II)
LQAIYDWRKRRVLQFELIQPGRIEITPEEGVKDSRPSSSLLQSGNCRTVIDTEHPKEDGREYVAAFRRLGLTPADVNCVVFTHLHPDHFGHKELFRNAVFVYHKDDKFGFYFKNDRRIVLEGNALLDVAAGSAARPAYVERDPDLHRLGSRIFIRHTPGHTPGSLVIFAFIAGLVHAWVGDVFLNQEYFDSWQPPGSSWDQRRIYAHMEYVKARADIIIPGHGAPFRKSKECGRLDGFAGTR